MKNRIRTYQIFKLVLRSALFLLALTAYILGFSIAPADAALWKKIIYPIIWIVFALDMILRFFPSKFESMGCQKQFQQNYVPREGVSRISEDVRRRNVRSVILVVASWLILNGIIGVIHLMGYISKAVMLLISLFYGMCDLICILFYCPFQSLLMQNRCCVSCRIYNWDFAMMFTPMIFVKSFFTWSLAVMSIILLIKWEVRYRRHPEWFSETTNACLDCSKCTEYLCVHKKAIRALAKKTKQAIYARDRKKIV